MSRQRQSYGAGRGVWANQHRLGAEETFVTGRLRDSRVCALMLIFSVTYIIQYMPPLLDGWGELSTLTPTSDSESVKLRTVCSAQMWPLTPSVLINLQPPVTARQGALSIMVPLEKKQVYWSRYYLSRQLAEVKIPPRQQRKRDRTGDGDRDEDGDVHDLLLRLNEETQSCWSCSLKCAEVIQEQEAFHTNKEQLYRVYK